MSDARSIVVHVDGNPHEMPLAFRAVHILVAAGLDGTYRIFACPPKQPLGRQLHPDEWVVPESDGAHYCCIPPAIGPGGGNDLRVQRIYEAHVLEIAQEVRDDAG